MWEIDLLLRQRNIALWHTLKLVVRPTPNFSVAEMSMNSHESR